MNEILVSVYGSLRQGHGNNRLLADAEFMGKQWIGPGYRMYSLGGFPGVVREPGEGMVKIEVYKVNKDILERLDHLEGFHSEGYKGNFYNRETIDTNWGKSFIYFLNTSEYYRDIVESGDWNEYRVSKVNLY